MPYETIETISEYLNRVGTPYIVAFDGSSLVKMKEIFGTLLFGAALAASNPEAATIGRGTGKTWDYSSYFNQYAYYGEPIRANRPKRTPDKALRYRRRKMAEVSRRANWKH